MSAPVHLPVLDDAAALDIQRPRTRGECVDGPRPCPWVSCDAHALHGVMLGAQGAHLSDDALVELLDTMPATCTNDVAERGDEAGTLLAIGDLWGVTRERIRQVESKALAHVLPHAEHLRDAIVEEPDTELRPTRGGEARPVEERRRIAPPAQHAHLPGPEGVTDGATAMWCPWIGAAMSGGLCARRHTARGKASAMRGAAGSTYPTYPGCALCSDGAAVAARVGTGGELANDITEDDVAKVHRKEAPAAPLTKTTSAGAKATKADAARKAFESRMHTTPGAVCPVPGCGLAAAPWTARLDPAMRVLCKRHRNHASRDRALNEELTAQGAVDGVIARAQGNGASPPPPAPATTPATEAERELVAARARVVELERERAILVADIARARAALVTQGTALAALERQVRELAAGRVEASPWARLERLYRAAHPDSSGCSFELGRAGDGWRAALCDVDMLGDGAAVHRGEGADPDAATAALVELVEGEARARVEAITAALGGQ